MRRALLSSAASVVTMPACVAPDAAMDCRLSRCPRNREQGSLSPREGPALGGHTKDAHTPGWRGPLPGGAAVTVTSIRAARDRRQLCVTAFRCLVRSESWPQQDCPSAVSPGTGGQTGTGKSLPRNSFREQRLLKLELSRGSGRCRKYLTLCYYKSERWPSRQARHFVTCHAWPHPL